MRGDIDSRMVHTQPRATSKDITNLDDYPNSRARLALVNKRPLTQANLTGGVPFTLYISPLITGGRRATRELPISRLSTHLVLAPVSGVELTYRCMKIRVHPDPAWWCS